MEAKGGAQHNSHGWSAEVREEEAHAETAAVAHQEGGGHQLFDFFSEGGVR